MDTAKRYQDSEGNDCSIWQMVKREPDWAANRIQEGEKAIIKLQVLSQHAVECKECQCLFIPGGIDTTDTCAGCYAKNLAAIIDAKEDCFQNIISHMHINESGMIAFEHRCYKRLYEKISEITK